MLPSRGPSRWSDLNSELLLLLRPTLRFCCLPFFPRVPGSRPVWAQPRFWWGWGVAVSSGRSPGRCFAGVPGLRLRPPPGL